MFQEFGTQRPWVHQRQGQPGQNQTQMAKKAHLKRGLGTMEIWARDSQTTGGGVYGHVQGNAYV